MDTILQYFHPDVPTKQLVWLVVCPFSWLKPSRICYVTFPTQTLTLYKSHMTISYCGDMASFGVQGREACYPNLYLLLRAAPQYSGNITWCGIYVTNDNTTLQREMSVPDASYYPIRISEHPHEMEIHSWLNRSSTRSSYTAPSLLCISHTEVV